MAGSAPVSRELLLTIKWNDQTGGGMTRMGRELGFIERALRNLNQGGGQFLGFLRGFSQSARFISGPLGRLLWSLESMVRLLGSAAPLAAKFGGLLGGLASGAFVLGRAFIELGRRIAAPLRRGIELVREFAEEGYSVFTELQATTTKVWANVARQGESAFGRTRDIIVQAMNQSGKTLKDVGDAAYDIFGSFEKESDQVNMLTAATRGAIIGFTELENVEKSLQTVMEAFNIQTKDAEKTVALMNAAVLRARVNWGLFAENIGMGASQMAEAGVSLKDYLATMALASKAAGPTSRVFTGMRSMIQSLAKPSGRMSAAQMGWVALDDKGGLDMLATLQRIRDALDKMPPFQRLQAIRMVLPNKNDAQTVLNILQRTKDEMFDMFRVAIDENKAWEDYQQILTKVTSQLQIQQQIFERRKELFAGFAFGGVRAAIMGPIMQAANAALLPLQNAARSVFNEQYLDRISQGVTRIIGRIAGAKVAWDEAGKPLTLAEFAIRKIEGYFARFADKIDYFINATLANVNWDSIGRDLAASWERWEKAAEGVAGWLGRVVESLQHMKGLGGILPGLSTRPAGGWMDAGAGGPPKTLFDRLVESLDRMATWLEKLN